MVVSKRGIWGEREREERRGSNSKNMCIEEFLTIFNYPSNHAYLQALLFLSILPDFDFKILGLKVSIFVTESLRGWIEREGLADRDS